MNLDTFQLQSDEITARIVEMVDGRDPFIVMSGVQTFVMRMLASFEAHPELQKALLHSYVTTAAHTEHIFTETHVH